MNVEVLEELLSQPLKSKLPKATSDNFQKQFRSYLNAEGFSKNAEDYLFKGVALGSIFVFFDYINSLDKNSQTKCYTNLLASSQYNTDGIVPFEIATILLRLSIQNNDFNLTKQSITDIVHKSKTKKNTIYYRVHKLILENFVFCIDIKQELKNIYSFGNTEIIINEFKSLISESLDSAKNKDPTNCIQLDKIRKWIYSEPIQQSVKIDKQEQYIENIKDKKIIPCHYKKDEEKNKIIPITDIKIHESLETLGELYSTFKHTIEYIDNLISEKNILSQRVEKLIIERAEFNKKYENINSELKNKKLDVTNLTTENKLLSNINTSTLSEIEKNKELIQQLEEKIKRQEAVISIFSTDKEDALTAQMNALGAKLRVEYKDFCDALNMEMTVDLGENLRGQLKSIFKILQKNNISFEE